MADYYSILNKTISGLKTNTPELRQAVYGKARLAIENQLRKLDPMPGEDAINAQLELLEEAITQIEAEHAPAKAALSDLPSPDVPQEEPLPEASPAENDPQEAAASPQSGPLVEGASVASSDIASARSDEPVGLPSDEDGFGSSSSSAIPSDSDAREMAPPPVVGMLQEADVPEPVDLGQPQKSDAPQDFDATSGIPDEIVQKAGRAKRRPVGAILAALIVLAVIVSGTYLIWSRIPSTPSPQLPEPAAVEEEPETETPLSGPSDDEATELQEEEVQQQPTDEAGENGIAEKEPVRLGADGQEEVVDPVEENSQDPESETQPSDEGTTIAPEDSTPEPVEESNDSAAQETEGVEGTENGSATPVPLGEVAYLYEEGSAGTGASRSNASVSWSVAQVKPAEALPPEAVIVGNMEVPDKGMQVEINIKRNVDEALSASHIIELTFDVPASFSGRSIDNIARFVMKPTEEARGEPLVAVPVKVNDGYFLIALDNLEQAVKVNNQLLTESSWIDIPITYATGKRALLTLEKGDSGIAAFRDAFADWENR